MAMSAYRSVIINKNHCPQSLGCEDPQSNTLPETDIDDFMPENQWLEDELVFFLGGRAGPDFQERNVTLPETNIAHENPHLSW